MRQTRIYEDIWIFFFGGGGGGVHHVIGLCLGVISMHFRVFFFTSRIFWGLLKFQIFLRSLKFLIFLGGEW